MEKDMSAYDVKREIEMHQQEKESLEADIPSSIVIGPFWINCDTVRNFLVKKRRELAKAVLELLAKKLRTQTEEVSIKIASFFEHAKYIFFNLQNLPKYICKL